MHLATVIHAYSGLIYCLIVFKISFKDTVCDNSKIKNLLRTLNTLIFFWLYKNLCQANTKKSRFLFAGFYCMQHVLKGDLCGTHMCIPNLGGTPVDNQPAPEL